MSAIASPLLAVDHIGIVVADIEAALSYYSGVLGMPVTHRETLHERSAKIAFVDAGNVLLQFVEPIDNRALVEFLARQGDGLHHVCFAVDDIDTALRSIAARAPDGIFPGGRGRRACFLSEQPAGIRIELYDDRTSEPDGGGADRQDRA